MLIEDYALAGDYGTVRVVDFMPRRGDGPPRLMRFVDGEARDAALAGTPAATR